MQINLSIEEMKVIKHLVEYQLGRLRLRRAQLEELSRKDENWDLDLMFCKERIETFNNVIQKLNDSINNK